MEQPDAQYIPESKFMALGEKLRMLRKSKGYSIRELCEHIRNNLNETPPHPLTVRNVEVGKFTPTFRIASQIAAACDHELNVEVELTLNPMKETAAHKD